jgi:predicted CXXCH cytochrome family protein
MKCENRHLTWAWLIAALLFFAFGTQSALAAIGTIIGSKHDFSASGPSTTYKGTSTQVCVYCHAPHNTSTTNQPLWNHATSTATYTVYGAAPGNPSSTLDAVISQPGGVSKLCLSCHDGTVAVDSFGGATGTKLVTGLPLLGTDLSNDHPIGFTYDAALVGKDPGLRNPATAQANIGVGGINAGFIQTKLLFGDKMECASCHDVHNSTAGTAVEDKLLRISNVSSALCTTCHIK